MAKQTGEAHGVWAAMRAVEKNQAGRCWGRGLTPRAGDQGRVWNKISGGEETALGDISSTLTVARPDVIML